MAYEDLESKKYEVFYKMVYKKKGKKGKGKKKKKWEKIYRVLDYILRNWIKI